MVSRNAQLRPDRRPALGAKRRGSGASRVGCSLRNKCVACQPQPQSTKYSSRARPFLIRLSDSRSGPLSARCTPCWAHSRNGDVSYFNRMRSESQATSGAASHCPLPNVEVEVNVPVNVPDGSNVPTKLTGRKSCLYGSFVGTGIITVVENARELISVDALLEFLPSQEPSSGQE
jgi:hypothetical protein